MENLKTVNLFDAVPYIAQTRFENEYNDYRDVTFQDIQKGIREIYKITAREFPTGQFWKDHHFKTVRTMLYNAVELVLDDPWTYNETCRVNADQLNKDHNIEVHLT
tara:strand:- start:32 stop:349 length:318 start_codon:yes stop_codon:yes gene_type:complete